MGHEVGLKGAYDCVKAFSEIDMTEDLGRIEVPTLIIHGDDDHSRRRRQIVPIKASACRSVQLVEGGHQRCSLLPSSSASPKKVRLPEESVRAAEPQPLPPGARPRAAVSKETSRPY